MTASRPSATGQRAVGTYLRYLAGLRPARPPLAPASGPPSAAPTATTLEEAFVAHARRWADRHGVDGGVLAEFGVTADVLARAGLPARSAAQAVRGRYTSMPFTVSQLARSANVSTATARATIRGDLEAGSLEQVGLTEGIGRPAQLYRTTRRSS